MNFFIVFVSAKRKHLSLSNNLRIDHPIIQKLWNTYIHQHLIDEFILVRVRLGGTGSSESRGYVEALGTYGQWGGVCDDSFHIEDAHVVCKMLGFPSAKKALASGTADNVYGTAPSGNDFVLDDLDCKGNEASVFDCQHNGVWNEDCGATDIAGVQCATSEPNLMSKTDFLVKLYFYLLTQLF